MTPESRFVASHLELALALEFSTPSESRKSKEANFRIEGFDDETVVTIPHKYTSKNGLIYGSKESIAFAILLGQLWKENQGNEARLFENGMHYGRFLAEQHRKHEERYIRSFEPNISNRDELKMFQEYFGLHDRDFEEIDRLTHQALLELEDRRLVVDPGILDDGLIVLMGLVPVKWSIRTPKGERAARDIKVQAALWDLEIKRRMRGNRKYADWDFTFRGLKVVKRIFRSIAEEYLDSEHKMRREDGKPTKKPPRDIGFSGDDEI